MNFQSLYQFKRQIINGDPITESSLQILVVVTLLAFLAIPLFVLSIRYPAAPSFGILSSPLSSAQPASAPLQIQPVLVASAESAGLLIAPTAEPVPVAQEPEEIVHPVKTDETLIGILKAYCGDSDYEAIARENSIDPHRIYANKTVLKFKNGCAHAPSVLVKQNVSPRELVSNGGASSGKQFPPRLSRDAEAHQLLPASGTASTAQPFRRSIVLRPAQAASAPLAIASEPARRMSLGNQPAASTVQCDDESIAPKEERFNERARLMQLCYMKHHRLSQAGALKKAKDRLVASVPKPDMISCESAAKEGLSLWVACMREHYGEIIHSAARLYRLDENLLLAVAYSESKGNPFAVSTSWCLSLMQVLPSTAEHFGVDLAKIFDPHVNIHTGARVLRTYLDGARGDLNRGLASYNLGPGEVHYRTAQRGFDHGSFGYTQRVLNVFRLLNAGQSRTASADPSTVAKVGFKAHSSSARRIVFRSILQTSERS